MRRLVLALAATAVLAGPVASAGEAYAQGREDRREARGSRGDDRGERRGERRGDGRDYREDRRDYRDGRRGEDRRDDRRGDDRRGDDRRAGPPPRWDDRRYNGYYYNDRWAYGPPPPSYWGRPGFRPDYRRWQRGAYLPPHYHSYVIEDYPRYRLRPPPRGYHWVRANDDYVLAAIATGLILDVIVGGY